MKIYVVQILVEDIDSNTCSVEVFKNLKDAQRYANDEIDNYAMDYDGNVIERAFLNYTMESGDTYVTISIEEKEIN